MYRRELTVCDLLQAKKVHLRPDFEPWHPVDVMDPADREMVFRKAGTLIAAVGLVNAHGA